jgi:hypothetical protein
LSARSRAGPPGFTRGYHADLAEIQPGLDPLGGHAFPNGVIASLPPRGPGKDVVVAGSPRRAEEQIAYVANGTGGLQVVRYLPLDNQGAAPPVALTGTIRPGALAVRAGGALRGAGTFAGDMTLAGALWPGDVSPFANITAPGMVAVGGNLTLSPGAVITADSAGAAAGAGYDQLQVAGRAMLAGTLRATVDRRFVPAVGIRFDVLTSALRDASFTTITGLTLGGGLVLAPEYGPNGLTLAVAPA